MGKLNAMRKIYLSILLLSLCACTRNVSNEAIEANEALFKSLDSLIVQSDLIIANKDARIDTIRLEREKAVQIEDLYCFNRELYNEYRVFNSDSALKYVNHNLELARLHKNKKWEATSLLDLSFIYTANGLLDAALKVLQPLKIQELPRNLRSRHYGQMRTLCSRWQIYMEGNTELKDYWGKQYALYSDSVLQVSTPDEPRYLYVRVWKYQDNPIKRKEIIQLLEEKKQSWRSDNRNYAILLYNLGDLYRKEGDETKWLENIILSGIADIRGCNRDIGSLHTLASYLYDNGCLDRAYLYSTCSFEIGYTYKSRVRMLHLSELQNRIHQNYIDRDKQQKANLFVYLILTSVLSALLISALFFLRSQVQKRRKAYSHLENVNEQLRHLNHELNDLNVELRDANYIKEGYIAQIFKLCSTYISKNEEYRKSLNRKLKTGQLEEIRKVITSASLENKEVKEFHEIFDSIFLSLFPDFIEGFNQLLRVEEHIKVKEGRLNTELRIHALIRLGITDSEKIAEFLHCSQQTVYNTRSMTYAKSIYPKEVFIHAVQELGKLKTMFTENRD